MELLEVFVSVVRKDVEFSVLIFKFTTYTTASRIAALQANLGNGALIIGGLRPGAMNALNKKKESQETRSIDNSAILERTAVEKRKRKKKRKVLNFEELEDGKIGTFYGVDAHSDLSKDYQTQQQNPSNMQSSDTKMMKAIQLEEIQATENEIQTNEHKRMSCGDIGPLITTEHNVNDNKPHSEETMEESQRSDHETKQENEELYNRDSQLQDTEFRKKEHNKKACTETTVSVPNRSSRRLPQNEKRQRLLHSEIKEEASSCWYLGLKCW